MTSSTRFSTALTMLLILSTTFPIFGLPISNATPPGSIRLSQSVLVVTAEGTNCVVIAGERGLAVIDTGPGPTAGATVRDAAQAAFGRQDFAYVISTHCHWDHVDGNQAFSDVTIVAHESCPESMVASFEDRARLAADPTPATAPPPPPPGVTLPPPAQEAPARMVGLGDENQRMDDTMRERFGAVLLTLPELTFSDRLQIDLGGCNLHLLSFGGGHSTSNILVAVPEEGLLLTGDIVAHGQLPLVTGDGIPEPHKWVQALDSLAEFEAIETVIPGHGEAITPTEWRFFSAYLRWLGEGVDQIPETGDPAADLLHGVLDLKNLPTPAPSLDPAITIAVHSANVEALVSALAGTSRSASIHGYRPRDALGAFLLIESWGRWSFSAAATSVKFQRQMTGTATSFRWQRQILPRLPTENPFNQ